MSEGISKTELRRQYRAALASQPATDRAAASASICDRLRAQPVWREARTILFFISRPDEPDIGPLMTEAFATERQVCLPRYSAEQEGYLPCLVAGEPLPLERGQFGLWEPTPACPGVDPNQLDLALVPGIAFSLAGDRLGRGKGYFDRLLAGIPGFKCGVAFDCQVTAELPVEPHDIRLNCILTPTRWLAISDRRRS